MKLFTPVLLAALAAQLPAVTVGQIDDFEDGTTQNWLVGLLGAPHPAPPVNMTGGPGGAMDHFMLITAVGGKGAGSRLSVLNPAQWGGDYKAAGIGSISLNVNNFSTQDIYLRLLFENPIMGPPTDEAITPAIIIPAGSGWVHVTFALDNLIAISGTAHNALTQATIMRIFHAVNDALPAEVVAARVGIDNIRANTVPEPSTAALVIAAGVGLLALRRRR